MKRTTLAVKDAIFSLPTRLAPTAASEVPACIPSEDR
jgi:hypothetical protein